jgi:putative addiction module CopG family antidote
MARTVTITLDDSLGQFIDWMVASGRHASADEVVEVDLRLIEERVTSHDALRSALMEGEAGGGFEDFDAAGFLSSMRHLPGAWTRV